MTKNKLLFILLILIATIIYCFFQLDFIKIYNPCLEYREIYEITFYGIVIEKKDTRLHHASRYILVGNSTEGSRKKIDLLGDNNINNNTGKSIFWELINEGDSVSKGKDTFVISYKNSKSKWVSMELGFTLCPD